MLGSTRATGYLGTVINNAGAAAVFFWGGGRRGESAGLAGLVENIQDAEKRRPLYGIGFPGGGGGGWPGENIRDAEERPSFMASDFQEGKRSLRCGGEGGGPNVKV